MPWHAQLHPDLPIVDACFSGIMTPDELTKAVQKTIELALQLDRVLVLSDCTHLAGGHSIVDLYYLADLVMANHFPNIPKEALIMPQLPASAEDVRFWETTCRNRGLQVKIFENRESAMAWLLEPVPGKNG